MSTINVKQVQEDVLDLANLAIEAAARAESSRRRYRRARTALKGLLKKHGRRLETSPSYVFFLVVALSAYILCAFIDASQSMVLWEDIMGTTLGGFVVASARISLAVLASSLLFEPFSPVIAGRGRSRNRTGSRSSRILERRSVTRWVFSGSGALLSIGLLYMMYQATASRVDLEVLAGLISFGAEHQRLVPVLAVAAEIITGFSVIELLTLGLGHGRRSLLAGRMSRSSARREEYVQLISKYWSAISNDLRTLERQGSPMLDLDIPPQLAAVLGELGRPTGFGPKPNSDVSPNDDNSSFDDTSPIPPDQPQPSNIGRLVPRPNAAAEG